ncbi:MAG: hypothetical protein KDE28_18970, partial [Anaerolineales bacterium]|nr:hypothetical protein [Anaerolineales bacterium]
MSFSFRKLFISTSIFCLSLVLFWGPGHSEEAAAQGSGFNFSVSDLVGHSNAAPSSLQFGPDDKLYVADRFGDVYVYEIVRNGP